MIAPRDAALLHALIRGACHDARREMPKVGSDEHPTPWDLSHEYLNDLLTELEYCGRTFVVDSLARWCEGKHEGEA